MAQGVQTLPTPIRVDRLAVHLNGYNIEKRHSLLHGFSFGFKIPSAIVTDPPKNSYQNHKSCVEFKDIISAKLRAECQLQRISGPHSIIPLTNFIVSPLGLVPKKEPGQFRIIHDLSFPKHNSVNSHIHPSHSTVKYELLDHCVEIIQRLGKGCYISKADLKDAFRIMPIHPSNYRLLGFTWESAYYYDRVLPMGCSVSCSLFEQFAQAIQWILKSKLLVKDMSHILDDFIFFGRDTVSCKRPLQTFFILAESLNLPIKEGKNSLSGNDCLSTWYRGRYSKNGDALARGKKIESDI